MENQLPQINMDNLQIIQQQLTDSSHKKPNYGVKIYTQTSLKQAKSYYMNSKTQGNEEKDLQIGHSIKNNKQQQYQGITQKQLIQTLRKNNKKNLDKLINLNQQQNKSQQIQFQNESLNSINFNTEQKSIEYLPFYKNSYLKPDSIIDTEIQYSNSKTVHQSVENSPKLKQQNNSLQIGYILNIENIGLSNSNPITEREQEQLPKVSKHNRFHSTTSCFENKEEYSYQSVNINNIKKLQINGKYKKQHDRIEMQQKPHMLSSVCKSNNSFQKNNSVSTSEYYNNKSLFPNQDSVLVEDDSLNKKRGFSCNRLTQVLIKDNLRDLDKELEQIINDTQRRNYTFKEFKNKINEFWSNFKVYYEGFQYNPSIKRIAQDMSNLLQEIAQYMNGFQKMYDDKVQEFSSAINENKTIKQKQTDAFIKIDKERIEWREKEQDMNNCFKISLKQHKIKENEFQNEKKKMDKIILDLQNQVNDLTCSLNENIKIKNEQSQKIIEQNKKIDELKQENKNIILRETMKKNFLELSHKSKIQEYNQKVDNLQKQIESQDLQFEKLENLNQTLLEEIQQNKQVLSVKDQKVKELDKKAALLHAQHEKTTINITNMQEEHEYTVSELEVQIDNLQNKLNMFVSSTYQHTIEKDSILNLGAFYKLKQNSIKQNFQINIGIINHYGDLDNIIYDNGSQDNVEYINFFNSCKKVNLGSYYNEEISINFEKIPDYIRGLCILISNEEIDKKSGDNLEEIQQQEEEQNLSNLQECYIHFQQFQKIINYAHVYNKSGCKDIVAYLIKEKNNSWSIIKTNKSIQKNNFNQIQETISSSLDQTSLQVNNKVQKMLKWNLKVKEVQNININEILPIPIKAYKNFVIGTGWTFENETVDIQTNLILLNKQNELLDLVNLQKQQSDCTAIQYEEIQEDQIESDQGEGIEQDNIKISLDLNKISQQVENIWLFLQIKEQDKYFDKIKQTYCKYMVKNKEFLRFEMETMKEDLINGCFMCNLQRIGNRWQLQGRGLFTEQQESIDNIIPIIQQIQNNDLSSVKVISMGNTKNQQQRKTIRASQMQRQSKFLESQDN